MSATSKTPTEFVVTEKAMRPASAERRCFYCHQPVGGHHLFECVLVKRKVVVQTTITHTIDVPAHWDKGMIEFYRNDGSWCQDNLIAELQEVAEAHDCLCPVANTVVLDMQAGVELEE